MGHPHCSPFGGNGWTWKFLLYGKNRQLCQLLTPGLVSSASGDFFSDKVQISVCFVKPLQVPKFFYWGDCQNHACTVPSDKWLIQGFPSTQCGCFHLLPSLRVTGFKSKLLAICKIKFKHHSGALLFHFNSS